MPSRHLCPCPCCATCKTLRVRGSAFAVYLSGLAWLFVALMKTSDPDYLRASIALGPVSIAVGGSAVFLAGVDPESDTRSPAVAYLALGSFSTGLSLASLPMLLTLSIAAFYLLVIAVSLPDTHSSDNQTHPSSRSTRAVVLGSPVGVTAQPLPTGIPSDDGVQTV